ncbi:MAG: TIGR00266 family protein [Candidatus Bathyarchaeota archaeon]|nr:TIGR00266 family protein [Candidatus Termiticorpusculum sp.]
MKFEVKYKPSYAMLVTSLEQGETITAESGAMTYMDPTIEIHTRKREKSLLGSLGLKLIGGQSFWVNDYTATKGPGNAAFVAAPVGDIERLNVTPGKGYIIQKASYIASTPDIDLNIKWEGFTKGLFGQGLFMLKATGNGPLFINTFGAIDIQTLQAGQTLIVDNFHLVGFSDTCNYKVTKLGGLKETFLSGEGLVTQITGPGEVFIQTKNLQEFVEWLWTLIGPKVAGTRAR